MAKKYFINRLFICNFKPFVYGNDEKKPYLEINFNKKTEEVSSMILSGPNGYGKTSIFQAINFTLVGMMYAGSYTYGKMNVDEHLVINNIEKPSFTAVELYEAVSGKYVTIIRYTQHGKTGKVKEAQEAVDFKAYIIDGKFDYNSFLLGKNENVDVSRISEYLGERDLSEWIGRNYIQQDYDKNILSQNKNSRINFLNEFIQRESNKYLGEINSTTKKELLSQIRELEKEVKDLAIKVNQEVKEIGGEEPLCKKVYPELDFIWDKSEYVDTEPFQNYIQNANDLIRVIEHADTYVERRKTELLNKISSFSSCYNQYILNLFSVQQLEHYTSSYKKKEYWTELLNNKDLFWNQELETQYLEKDMLDQLSDTRKEHNNWETNRSEKGILREEIEEYRAALLDKEGILQETFGNICPLCGSDFNKEDKSLVLAIREAANILKKTETLLDKALDEKNQAWYEKYLKIRQELTQLVEGEGTKEEICKAIIGIKQVVPQIEQIRSGLQELNIFQENSGLEIFMDNASFQAHYNDLSLYENAVGDFKLALSQLEENEKSEQLDTDIVLYSKFEQYLAKLKKGGFKIDELQNKVQYLTWREKKKAALEYSGTKAEYETKREKLKKLYIKRAKWDKISECINNAKKQYLNDLINYIEIPFYIYSGKLIQTFQEGLGLFCYSGSKDDSLTEFKIAVSKNGLDRQLDVTSKFSSGQKNVTNIALMLALKKIAQTDLDIFMIDDPCQSLDELNIASFVEIIKNEFKDMQLILSTHEDRIAGYINYKCEKAGKNIKLYDVQKEVYAMTTE